MSSMSRKYYLNDIIKWLKRDGWADIVKESGDPFVKRVLSVQSVLSVRKANVDFIKDPNVQWKVDEMVGVYLN